MQPTTEQEATNITPSEEQKKSYPTPADLDGYYFDSEAEEMMGIKTKVYDNGNFIKTAHLPRCGKTAVVREMIAKDNVLVRRFMGDDEELAQFANITVSTTLDGKAPAMEDIIPLKQKDYIRLVTMYQALNF